MAFPSQPPNWVEGQQALINGVTYVYSLANSSWSPLTSANTLTYPTITATTSTITGTATIGNSVVTGNEAVQGNETVTGNQIVLGNLGIGTNTPLKTLDMYGSSFGVRNGNGYGFAPSFEATFPGSPVSARLSFGADNTGWQMRFAKNVSGSYTDYMTINDSGNVGVGTTSPTVKLDVAGDIKTSGSLTIGTGGTYVAGSIYSDANWGMLFRAKVSGVATDFAWHNSSDGEWMRIGNTGNVGIGTISPGVKLDVNGTIRSTYQSITNGTTNQYVGMSLANLYNTDASDGISFIDSQGRNNVTDSALFFGHRANYGSYISFYTQSNSGTNTDRRTQQMLIENNGTVYLYGGGGGTQISMRNGGDLTIYSADNSYGTTIWCDPPTTGMTNTGYTFTEYLNLNSQRCGYDRLWDNYPSISVRNDTTNGGQGEFRIHGINGISGGDFSVYLRVDGGGNGSDRRRKTDIEPIINALETISKLKPVTYVATNSSLEKQTEMSMANGKRLGFIAQDLIPVLPEVVKDSGVENIRENGWADQYAVDYASMVSLLTAGVQELKTIVQPDNTFKVGVEPLSYGLNEVLKIKPIIYREMTSTGIIRNHEGNKLSGFADEDLENLMPGVELTNDAIIGALINAIKELKEEITQLKKQESRVIVISK